MQLAAPRPVGENPLRPVEVETPTPGAHEIRIAIRMCGVCHTDLHTVEGEIALPKLPVIPGHQIVGVVDQVGSAVTRFRVGERVGVPWLNSTDQTCAYCRRGEENLCDRAQFTGLDVDGGYAEAVAIDQDYAYAIPAGFEDAQAAPLLCGGVIGFRALRVCGVQPGERIGLYGFGSSAHIAIQVARHWNCEVYVMTRGAEHRALARQLGAAWTGGAEETPPAPLDRAIIFAPVGRLVLDALRVLRKGGTVATAGIYSTPIPEMDYALLYGERVVRSVANSTRADVQDFLKVATAGIYSTPIPEIDYALLYGERVVRSVANSTRADVQDFLKVAAGIPVKSAVQLFPLSEANRVLQLLKASKVDGAAVLKVV